MKEKSSKLWGGRFTEATDEFVEQFNASVGFDKRLYKHDILGSKVHAQMLARIGVLSKQDCDQLIKALDEIEAEIETGKFEWDSQFGRCAYEYRGTSY